MPIPEYARDPDIALLADEMKRLRAEAGLTYEQLAERTRMSRRSVIAYEQGDTMGTLRHWFRISDALGVQFSQFVQMLDADNAE